MNALHRTCRRVLGAAALASCLAATAFAQDDNILGTWNCGLTIQDQEAGVSMNVQFEQTYDENGTYVREGQMNISITALQATISVAIDEEGTWKFADSLVVTEMITRLELSPTSEMPTQIEQMIAQQMQAEAQAEISDEQTVNLKSLTATTMEFEDADGMVSTCQKA